MADDGKTTTAAPPAAPDLVEIMRSLGFDTTGQVDISQWQPADLIALLTLANQKAQNEQAALRADQVAARAEQGREAAQKLAQDKTDEARREKSQYEEADERVENFFLALDQLGSPKDINPILADDSPDERKGKHADAALIAKLKAAQNDPALKTILSKFLSSDEGVATLAAFNPDPLTGINIANKDGVVDLRDEKVIKLKSLVLDVIDNPRVNKKLVNSESKESEQGFFSQTLKVIDSLKKTGMKHPAVETIGGVIESVGAWHNLAEAIRPGTDLIGRFEGAVSTFLSKEDRKGFVQDVMGDSARLERVAGAFTYCKEHIGNYVPKEVSKVIDATKGLFDKGDGGSQTLPPAFTKNGGRSRG